MRVFDLAFTGYAQAEVIRTLCALGVAEALAGGPKTAEELASELGEGTGSCAHWHFCSQFIGVRSGTAPYTCTTDQRPCICDTACCES